MIKSAADISQNYSGLRSFTTKLSLLAFIFILVPLFVYYQLQKTDNTKNRLLHDTMVHEDRLVVEVLKPYIAAFGTDKPGDLQNVLNRLADDGTNIKLLYRPKQQKAAGLFYIASAPALSPDQLEREYRALERLNVFGKIAEGCADDAQVSARFTNPLGLEEMLTTLTSLSTAEGFWAIITSRSGSAFLEAAAEKPFWRTASIQIAAAIYLASALLIAWLSADIWRNVALFRQAARRIRLRGASGISFVEANRIPELARVAEDFDGLVKALVEGQATMKAAAEENAHALKTSLGIIAQSLERLKKLIPSHDEGAKRSLDLIEQATERLDGLVSAVRALDQAAADSLYPERWPIDLSTFLGRLTSAYANTLAGAQKSLVISIAPDVHVLASEDFLEPIVENILENAASFAPQRSSISVSLSKSRNLAKLVFADEGPGVAPHLLSRIFERYYSSRPHEGTGAKEADKAKENFGLGLWIVKRNVEAMGGTVKAEPNEPHGFKITVELPLV